MSMFERIMADIEETMRNPVKDGDVNCLANLNRTLTQEEIELIEAKCNRAIRTHTPHSLILINKTYYLINIVNHTLFSEYKEKHGTMMKVYKKFRETVELKHVA